MIFISAIYRRQVDGFVEKKGYRKETRERES